MKENSRSHPKSFLKHLEEQALWETWPLPRIKWFINSWDFKINSLNYTERSIGDLFPKLGVREVQPSPNAVINIRLPTKPLSDDEIAEFVTNFIQTFPITVGAWGPWQTTETANGDDGEDWLHDWPAKIEEQTKIVRSSALTDSFGKRRGETGSFVQLKREFKHEDLGTNYCWEARFCIGHAGLPGVSNAISLAVPTADQKQGCATSAIRDYLEVMIESTAPTWANLRDMRFARKLRESGSGRWVEGRIPSAWMTFVSWSEIEARRIDVDNISRLVEVDTREDGIMAKVPGPFEDPDMDIAVKLSDLTQMPEHPQTSGAPSESTTQTAHPRSR